MWSFSSILGTLTLLLASCSTLASLRLSLKPSPYVMRAQDQARQDNADRIKFCNPNYEYGPNETPVIHSCATIPNCDDTVLQGDPVRARCLSSL